MKEILLVIQVVVAILLVGIIMLQNRGGGIGSVFGGESAVYRSRRGAEKLMHYATIALAVVFCVLSFSSVILY